MTKKNVLIVAGVFPPEPIVSANLYFDLAVELSREFNVTVIRPKPTRPLGFNMKEIDFSDYAFKVVTINSYTCPESSLLGRWRESRSMGQNVVEYLRNHENVYDFIYNDPWQIFGINMVAKEAIRQGIPYIVPVQDIYPEALMHKLPSIPLLKWLVRKLLLPIDRFNLVNASCVHTISDKMVNYLSETRDVPKNRFVCVRNWQNDKIFTTFEGSGKKVEKDSKFTFMYLGNVGFLAGLDVVIDAFAKSGLDDASLIIAGAGAAKEGLIERVKNLNVSNIRFMEVPAGKVPEIQAMADVMVLPVKKGYALTSIPSKLPAYWFSSKAILASVDKESDTANCISQANGGWIVEPEDSEALASMMKNIVSVPVDEIVSKGKNGHEFAMENLSRKRNLSVLVNRIKEIIKQH